VIRMVSRYKRRNIHKKKEGKFVIIKNFLQKIDKNIIFVV